MVGRARSAIVRFWSLAVEEQFYLLWPMTLRACALWRRPRVFVSVRLLVIVACPIVRAMLTAGRFRPGVGNHLCCRATRTVSRAPPMKPRQWHHEERARPTRDGGIFAHRPA